MNQYRLATIAMALALALVSGLSGCILAGAAAVGGTAVVATDRRTTGAYMDDQTIAARAGNQISERIPQSHVNLNSYNRAVLMTGEVPDAGSRDQAEIIVRGQPDVRRVYNYTEAAPASTMSERSNDTWITTKVRSNLMAGSGYPFNQVKVTTERGVVYLMGLLTPEEAAAAARVVSETSGVHRVVTLFETYSAPPKDSKAAGESSPSSDPVISDNADKR